MFKGLYNLIYLIHDDIFLSCFYFSISSLKYSKNLFQKNLKFKLKLRFQLVVLPPIFSKQILVTKKCEKMIAKQSFSQTKLLPKL